jgi:hypothetical protein
MRTIPEIVAEMRSLIEELEGHVGKPPEKKLDDTIISFPSYDEYSYGAGQPTINLSMEEFDNMNNTFVLGDKGLGIKT